MKSNFLKQISRMLVFGMLITGFPVDAASSTTNPLQCPQGFGYATTNSNANNDKACVSAFGVNPGNLQTNPSNNQPILPDSTDYSITPGAVVNGAAVAGCDLNACAKSLLSSDQWTTAAFNTAGIVPAAQNSPQDQTFALESISAALSANLELYQNAIQQFSAGTMLVTSYANILKSYLMFDPSISKLTTQPLAPIVSGYYQENGTAAGLASNVYTKVTGDFLPLSAAKSYNPNLLMAGFVAYNVLSTGAQWTVYTDVLGVLILMTVLTPASISKLAYSDLTPMLDTFAGNILTPAPSYKKIPNSTPVQIYNYLINEYSTVYLSGQNISFNPGALGSLDVNGNLTPNATFNLLANLGSLRANLGSNVYWEAIFNDPAQLSVLASLASTSQTSSPFTTIFPSANTTNELGWAQYFINSFNALKNNQAYFRCEQNIYVPGYTTTATPGTPIDSSVYYSPSPVTYNTITLSQQFAADQTSALTAMGSTSTTPAIQLPETFVDQSFSYATGTFYDSWMPSTAQAGTMGALDIIYGGTTDYLWHAVCDTSATGNLLAGQAAMITNLKTITEMPVQTSVAPLLSVGSPAVPPVPAVPAVAAKPATATSPSVPAKKEIPKIPAVAATPTIYGPATYSVGTIGGLMLNLLAAAQAAVGLPIFQNFTGPKGFLNWAALPAGTSFADWYNTNYPPMFQKEVKSLDGSVSFTPWILSNFIGTGEEGDTSFASLANQSILQDVSTIIETYRNCWSNLIACSVTNTPSQPGVFDQLKKQFLTKNGIIIVVASGVIFTVAVSIIVKFKSLIWNGIKSLFGIPKAQDVMAQLQEKIVDLQAQVDNNATQVKSNTQASKEAAEKYTSADSRASGSGSSTAPTAPTTNPVNNDPINPDQYQQLQMANDNYTQQLENFQSLTSGDQEILKQNLIQALTDAQKAVNQELEDAQDELNQAKANAEKYNSIAGEEDRIAIPE